MTAPPKCFGHPIGASGIRMIYENYLQLLGRADERQRKDQPVFGSATISDAYPERVLYRHRGADRCMIS